jgi:hypothetical protein
MAGGQCLVVRHPVSGAGEAGAVASGPPVHGQRSDVWWGAVACGLMVALAGTRAGCRRDTPAAGTGDTVPANAARPVTWPGAAGAGACFPGPEDPGPLGPAGLIFVLGLIYVVSIPAGAFRRRPAHGKDVIMSIKIRKVEDLKATTDSRLCIVFMSTYYCLS